MKKELVTARVDSLIQMSYEVFEREWFKILRKYWRESLSIHYLQYLLMAQNFRSNLMRIYAYSKMEELPLKEFRKRILLSLVNNPLNLFNRKFMSALFRAILGHQYINRIKYFFGLENV